MLNLPVLQESLSPNGWSRKLVLLVFWLSMVCEYLAEFSHCRDHLKVTNRVIVINFGKKTVWGKFSILHSLTLQPNQEGENSQDNQNTKRTSFPDQPFGLATLGVQVSLWHFKHFLAHIYITSNMSLPLISIYLQYVPTSNMYLYLQYFPTPSMYLPLLCPYP